MAMNYRFELEPQNARARARTFSNALTMNYYGSILVPTFVCRLLELVP